METKNFGNNWYLDYIVAVTSQGLKKDAILGHLNPATLILIFKKKKKNLS